MVEPDIVAATGVAAVAAGVEDAGMRLRRCFARGNAHRHALAYLRRLLSAAERKNGWQLAEQAGHAHPRSIQRVLDRSVWDAEHARDELRAYVVEQLGSPDGVLEVGS